MFEKWIKLKYDNCPNCHNKKKCFITYFVHATEEYDSEDYWCTLSNCSCKGKLSGNYIKICSSCKFTGELNDTEVEMLD